MEKAMFTLEDVETIENGDEGYFLSLQRAINSGSAWSLQGSMGRAMMAAIEDGNCMLGTERAIDYWRNVVPSRFDVLEGTKGSRSYVVKHSGEDWAQMMEDV
jgi:hypothetical protein